MDITDSKEQIFKEMVEIFEVRLRIPLKRH